MHATLLLALVLILTGPLRASAQVPTLVDVTAQWIPAGIQGDFQEKDFAFGDVDLDGDLDLVVARKLPFYQDSQAGTLALKDFLLLNDGGTFVDVTDTAVWPGILTKARDVWIGDLTADRFPEVLIVTTANSPLRLYVNQGKDPSTGSWLGFDDESWRLPTLPGPVAFCSADGGDVDGDGGVDLFLGGYRDPTNGVSDNFLLMNLCTESAPGDPACTGEGLPPGDDDTFRDDTLMRVPMVAYDNHGDPYPDFNTQVDLVDMNEDGHLDLLRLLAHPDGAPDGFGADGHLDIFLNDQTGSFFGAQVRVEDPFARDQNYMYAIADLDRDANRRPDFYVVDDGVDRFFFGDAVAPGGTPSFTGPHFVSTSNAGDFDGNLSLGDIDFDGFPDAAVASADVEIAGCPDGMELMMNTLNAGSGNRQFSEAFGEWSSVPNFENTFVDLDGDSCVELVIGACGNTPSGYRVFAMPHCPACDANDDGAVNLQDALLAMRIAGGKAQAPSDPGVFARLDVAPQHAPDGRVDVADALLILRGAAGSGRGVCSVAAAQP